MNATAEDIFNIAAMSLATEACQQVQEPRSRANSGFDVGQFLANHGVPFRIKTHPAGTLFCLENCLFNEGHGRDAAILQLASGTLTYKCFHDSCSGKTWPDARTLISGDEGITQSRTDNLEMIRRIDHLQVAEVVIAQFGADNLVFVSDLKVFRKWNGQVWTELDDCVIKMAVIQYLNSRTDKVTKVLVDSVVSLVSTLASRPDIKWDADTGVIPVQNGELEFQGNQWDLKPHARDHYRTTLIPIEYDPGARAPRFQQFLGEVFAGDEDAVDKAILICEMMGYTLTTSCSFEKFIILLGAGANGKSVLLDVLRLLVGSGQVAAVQPERMDNPFHRAHLCGKLVNIVTEIKEGGEIADAALKAITSGELTTAEHKFKPPFDFQPFATCWFATNHMPHTRDFSDALFRRVLIVEFNRVFREHEQDKSLKTKLAAELSGILLLSLTAFAGVIQRGNFTVPSSCIKAKEDWRIESDQVAQFIRDRCIIDADGLVLTGALYQAYKAWADDMGIRMKLAHKSFSQRVERLGGNKTRESARRFFAGISLRAAG